MSGVRVELDDLMNAKALLVSLRYEANQIITNCFGERVWLKPALDESGKRIGITDCCSVDDPCPVHSPGGDHD